MTKIDDWLKYKIGSEGCASATVVKYRGHLERLAEWLRGRNTPLLEATFDQLQEFTGFYLHKAGVSPSSRKVFVAAVRGFFSWCCENKLINESPAELLPSPRIGRKIPKLISLHSAEKLLMQPDIDTFAGLRDATMIALLMSCGMRVSGLVKLNLGCIHWYKFNELDRIALKLTEKGGHERYVPVDAAAMLLLQAYTGHPDFLSIDKFLPDGDQVLFVSLRNRLVPEHEYRGENRRIKESSVWRMMQRYGEKAGIPSDQLHPHALRHLLGTEMTESDATTLQIQTALGHRSADSSAIYARTALRKLTQVMDRSNPLAKVKTPVSGLLGEFRKNGVI